ncbi:uncharacterized protein LOC111062500 [Nilaparvata lugens]|uniref:uncharacterized protein LOC111062500 n=1 Tax=Nilaparvata lugens TaxID=108931 RepID=UPI00193E978A|nr:uncharacterized protein LOC111062500 [Nilaparvata lugens]
MASQHFILSLLCLLPMIYIAESIKCWTCRSDADPKCGDPFDNSTLPITDCKLQDNLPHIKDVRPTMCRKIRQKVHGQWRYYRGCAYLGEPGIGGDERYCLMRTGSYNIFMEYCTCISKDGCNTGSQLQFSLPLIVLGCAAIFVSVR